MKLEEEQEEEPDEQRIGREKQEKIKYVRVVWGATRKVLVGTVGDRGDC